jgi:hypothetical protein
LSRLLSFLLSRLLSFLLSRLLSFLMSCLMSHLLSFPVVSGYLSSCILPNWLSKYNSEFS